MAMIAAEELGILTEQVRANIADTTSLGHNDMTEGVAELSPREWPLFLQLGTPSVSSNSAPRKCGATKERCYLGERAGHRNRR